MKIIEEVTLVDLTSKEFTNLRLPMLYKFYFAEVGIVLDGEKYWIDHDRTFGISISANPEDKSKGTDRVCGLTTKYFQNMIISNPIDLREEGMKSLFYDTKIFNIKIVKEAVQNFYEPNFSDVSVSVYLGYLLKKDIKNLNIPKEKIDIDENSKEGISAYNMLRFELHDAGIISYKKRYDLGVHIMTPTIKNHKGKA